MLKKLRLVRSDSFQHHFAVRESARIVCQYLSSIATARYIGCELGDLEAWDDVVIEKENGDLHHFQVKRQLVAFSKDAAKRDTISKGPRVGQLRDPSELDKAMASLATHFDPTASATTTVRRFFIVCPAPVEVKEGLTLAHLADLCSESRKAGVTATSMAARADSATTAVFDWLTTWCGFRDWTHILCALRSLSVEYVGEESSIHQSTDQILAEWFVDAAAARAQIYSFLQENSSDVGAPSPRQILSSLVGALRPDKARWINYRRNLSDGSWHVSGTSNLLGQGIELARDLPKRLWSTNVIANRLQVDSTWPSGLHGRSIERQFVRLALHIRQPNHALFRELAGWTVGATAAVNGTLGTSRNDVECGWLQLTSTCSISDTRLLSSSSEQEQEADGLSRAMDEECWHSIASGVRERIRSMPTSELRDAVERLWTSWDLELSRDPKVVGDMLEAMMTSAAEGHVPMARARVGPRTVLLLTDAVFLNLLTATAVGGAAPSLNSYSDGSRVKTVALKSWARKGKVLDIFTSGEEAEISAALGEPENVLLFSGTTQSETDIYRLSMADEGVDQSLATPFQLKRIVTSSYGLTKAMNSGSIDEVRGHINVRLQQMTADRASRIAAFSL